MTTTIIVQEDFEAAHALPQHLGRCRFLHGHRYRLRAEIAGELSPRTGMVADLDIVRMRVASILPDHKVLAPVDYPPQPTVESVAAVLWRRLELALDDGLELVALELWENEWAGVRLTR